ncbi:hypothetical protein CWI75_07465 [Kineobactrum sediminis]|uniref:Uncharacterized protein n=1 Tax=Kineobactrum sediminis TaxID=1905677 RepID=A0A2N5Y4D4_9GAMM|nr:hypothetical protein [Kineobactrum sediminis]PLW83238.1 hypothetical protein CWI75_07465 [Kineobactrum sediminis]
MIEDDGQLPSENQEAIREHALETQRELQVKFIESSWRLTQHNFISNAGGAVAVLGYMGASNAGGWAVYPLLLFALGIISSTVEVRALLSTYACLYEATSDVLERILGRSFGLNDTKLDTKGSNVAGNVNKYASYLSQTSFIVGVLVGGYFYVCAV